MNINSEYQQANKRYAVILAGGEGSRLKTLTRTITGDERPKQFCSILGDPTLLDETRRRVSMAVPFGNTYFSLTEGHRRYFGPLLAGVPDRLKVVQPQNRGTAPAILYSLMRLAIEDADATVAFFPSDHYFSDNAALMQYVRSAFDAAETTAGSIVLLGIQPEMAETSYGWIEPVNSLFGDVDGSFSRVAKFWEKPTAGVARHLMASGCLWNSFVMIGKVGVFVDMFRNHLPGMFCMFSAAAKTFGTPQEAATISSIYNWIEETNFSTQVLERSAADLLVMRVGNVGWSDWGEPQRVLGTLNMLGVQTEWMQALAA